MRFIAALVSGCALLAAGCNSKAPEPRADEEPSAQPRTSAKPVFRQRAAAAPGESNETVIAKAPAPTAKRRSAPIAARENPVVPQQEQAETGEDTPTETTAENVRPEDIPQEGDEVLIPPRLLGKLLPGVNFDSVERQEPINVNSLLESQGIVFTNYQQLVEMGITNYQIIRASKPATAEESPPEK